MAEWWEIKYFDRDGLAVYSSSMIPFKILPELEHLDIKNGHKFKTDQFEITIPGTKILLHMPSRSIWVDGAPHLVKNAERVVLFKRTKASATSEIIGQNIYLGLLTESGDGLIVKYDTNSKTHTLQPYQSTLSISEK